MDTYEEVQWHVWLCEITSQLPVEGACPVHGGDNCIARYVHDEVK